ncbi:hypothetical protein [Aquisphaera insulae]|uniref:hypothetical protein n=1 Tax=Aquisphaera insulae TaxID=2712864 RepID=UPI0013EDD1B9|nr:hypothetical protein [Aquisphaera insulae]
MLCCILFIRDTSASRPHALRERLFSGRARRHGAGTRPDGDPPPSPSPVITGEEIDTDSDPAAILGVAAPAAAAPAMTRNQFQPGLVRLIGEILRNATTHRGPREGSARW